MIGPLWAGYLFQHLGIASPFLVGAGLVAAAWALAWKIPEPGWEGTGKGEGKGKGKGKGTGAGEGRGEVKVEGEVEVMGEAKA